jgi:predicted nucleotidyltransferase
MKKEELAELIWEYTAELGEMVDTDTVLDLRPELEQNVVEEAINDFKNTEAGMFYLIESLKTEEEKAAYIKCSELAIKHSEEMGELIDIETMSRLHPEFSVYILKEVLNDLRM